MIMRMKDKMEKVSIIIPIYKVEGYILNTLRSIVNQTYKEYEIILVDDGTPDRSIEQAEKYLTQFKEVKWKVIHQENKGLSAARNTGIENATGEWIICPDGDDTLDPNTIKRMIEAGRSNNIDCVFCGYQSVKLEEIDKRMNDEGKTLILANQEIKQRFLNRELILLVPAMLIRREALRELRFDSGCPYDEDIHFLWQLLFRIEKAAYIPAKFYNYLDREGSMVHNLKPGDYLLTSSAYAKMEKGLLEKYPQEKQLILKIYPKYRLGGCHVLAKANDYSTFKKTVLQDGYRRDMQRLIIHNNFKLSIYALLFCMSLKLFYLISR